MLTSSGRLAPPLLWVPLLQRPPRHQQRELQLPQLLLRRQSPSTCCLPCPWPARPWLKAWPLGSNRIYQGWRCLLAVRSEPRHGPQLHRVNGRHRLVLCLLCKALRSDQPLVRLRVAHTRVLSLQMLLLRRLRLKLRPKVCLLLRLPRAHPLVLATLQPRPSQCSSPCSKMAPS